MNPTLHDPGVPQSSLSGLWALLYCVLFSGLSLFCSSLSPTGTQILEYSRLRVNAYWMSEFTQERKWGVLKRSIQSLACNWFQWDIKYLSPPVLPSQWKNRSKGKQNKTKQTKTKQNNNTETKQNAKHVHFKEYRAAWEAWGQQRTSAMPHGNGQRSRQMRAQTWCDRILFIHKTLHVSYMR